jgi:hypothetical protein
MRFVNRGRPIAPVLSEPRSSISDSSIRQALEIAISVATLAWGPCAYGLEAQTFADAEVYWSTPVTIEGDTRHHDAATHDLAPSNCGICHPKQYEEWRGSLHALAVSPGLLGQLGALSYRERRDCFACHLPALERQNEWELRGLNAVPDLHGVECAACHVRSQQRHGPRARPETPHGAVEELGLFRSSKFCAPCHQFGPKAIRINGKPLENTHAEWSDSHYGREGRTCQSCHMPDGSHRFAGVHDPSMTARALKVTAVRNASGVTVEAANVGAGHALPTYSVPRIRIILIAGGTGLLEYSIQRRMDWDEENGWRELADTRLMPGDEITLSHPLSTGARAEVRVWVEPDADYFERVYPALLDILGEDSPDEEIALLEMARQRAGASPYMLLRMTCTAFRGEVAPCMAETGPSGRTDLRPEYASGTYQYIPPSKRDSRSRIDD